MSQYADTWRDLHIIFNYSCFTRVPVAQAVGTAFGFDVSRGRGRWWFFVVEIPFCQGHLTGSRCTVLKIRDDPQVPALNSHLTSLSITPNLVFDVATFAPVSSLRMVHGNGNSILSDPNSLRLSFYEYRDVFLQIDVTFLAFRWRINIWSYGKNGMSSVTVPEKTKSQRNPWVWILRLYIN